MNENDLQKDRQVRLQDMRRRLYARNANGESIERHDLTDKPVDVSRNWGEPATAQAPNTTDLRSGMETAVSSPDPLSPTTPPPPVVAVRPRRRYRAFILIGSLLIFILVAGLSSLYLYLGGNQISGNNISVAMSGPRSVGGGETLPLQVVVTNENSVTIEAATLIIKYPPGTLSTDQPPRSLYEERIPLSAIQPGEVRNIPVRAALFGDENTKQSIDATLEYRIIGSNGTFFKEADTFSVLIGSSPLVLRLENIEKLASGQVTDIVLTAVSNASTPLYNVLITAEYPNGFSYQGSAPEPVFNNNVWRIDELAPEQSVQIKLKGVVTGFNDESFRINFTAGPADQDNQYQIGSLLVETGVEFTIERPFIDIELKINGETGSSVVLEQGKSPKVKVEIANTLDETVYDMKVEAVPDGNAISARSIQAGSGGFFDSNTNTVRWEVSSNSNFAEVFPGNKRDLEFSIMPGSVQSTASFGLTVNVYARRVAERSASEELIGSTRIEAKYASEVFIGGQAGYSTGLFTDTGSVPPQVGKETTYTVTVVAEAGANDVSGAVVNTSLPIYVDWLDQYQGQGELSYNTVNKQIRWDVGDIPARERKELSMQLRIQPSSSQVGSTPTLLNSQRFRATDRYTNTLLQASAPAITTELSTEYGFDKENGTVVR